ncbi:MAG: hypothetical protein R2940_06925 [Syntrophotaleaceae bacterium]
MTSSKELTVEDIVKARCPSCKKAQNQTVVEIVDEGTLRIRCNVCQNSRIYQRAKASKAQKTARKDAPLSSRTRAAQTACERKEWASLRPGMQTEKAVPYCMAGTYHVRDLVQHLSFGLGLVTRQTGPCKIEVLFQEGKKLLCCQKPASAEKDVY